MKSFDEDFLILYLCWDWTGVFELVGSYPPDWT